MKYFYMLLVSLVTTLFAFTQKNNGWSMHLSGTDFPKDKGVARKTFPTEFKLYDLNLSAIRAELFKVVDNAQSHTAILSLPNADGEMEDFEIVEASNFEPALQAQFPEIRAFSGRGITDKAAMLKLSYSPQGIQTMVFRANGKPSEYIEPYSEDHSVYAVFKKTSRPGNLNWVCSTPEKDLVLGLNDQVNRVGNTLRSTGDLKTMRLAQSVNAEYSNYFGASSSAQVSLVLAAVNATITRCNGCYEKDLAIHLNLISNTTSVFYYNPSTDPYTTLANWNSQLQTTLTSVIGEANYDIGHMFGASGGGGNAGCIGCVCVNNQKGSGITSPADAIPQGDNFDIDYVVHEIGHQMGGNHTFSMSLEGSGVNKEVGSGITIMGYAGITSQDVAPHSIDIYHEATIQQIQTNISGKTCPVTTSLSGNNATPVVAAVSNYTIPKSTPFALTGSATDANTGDVLTYCWEQDDNATTTGAASAASATKTTGPNWISWPPTTSPTRIFPKLDRILAGQLFTPPITGGTAGINIEYLSSVARTLKFRLTVRDNCPYSSTAPIKVGQTQYTDMTVTVDAASGPFAVTGLDATGTSWSAGTTQTITWSVNNTTAAPINCATVNILLSTDGGLTFPITLASATPNDGTQAITIPNNATTTGRIKVEAVGNIFFDINNANFTITAAAGSFNFTTSNGATATCGSSSATASLATTATGGFSTAINLTATGNPAGTTVSFSTNPLTPGNSTNVTLNNISGLAPGTYNVTVTGVAGSVTQSSIIAFTITAGSAPAITSQPINNSICPGAVASFSVLTTATGVSYQWQRSIDGGVSWTNISGAVASTYSISGVTALMNNYRFRVTLTTLCASITSNVAVLTVKSTSQSSNNANVCNSYVWNGNTYTNSGTYSFTTTNAVGCDSLAILNLVVRRSSQSTNTANVCNSYVWNGNTYTISGTYTYTTTNAAGCDSLAILNLVVRRSSQSTNTANVCNSYVWNGNTYTISGTYTYTTTNAAGCDSLAILNLVVRKSSQSINQVNVCKSYNWNGNTYSSSGAYTYTTTNSVGCDSIAILNLTIRSTTQSTTTASSCGSYYWNGNTYTSTGVYTYNTTNAAGCDSIAILNVTITPITQSSTSITACGSYYWAANGQTYSSSGTYSSISGCNTQILNLSLSNVVTNTTNITACGNYTWSQNGITYNTSGSYTSINGCITNILNLVVSNTKTIFNQVVACNQYALPWGVMVYTSGYYTNVYSLSSGCDSVVTYAVTINTSITSFTNVSVCSNQLPYVWNNNNYTASGVYTHTTSNVNGCDSTQILNLVVSSSTSSSIGKSICSNQLPYTWNGVIFSAAGTQSLILSNVAGCDSLITMTLTVSNGLPTAPTALTQTLIDNNCGSRIYRYSAGIVTNAIGYTWAIPSSVGGISGVVVDSGDILTSRVIRLRWTSNAAALTTDSMRVMSYNGCGASSLKGFKLTNTALSVPAAPSSITVTALQTNVCNARIYRYTAPVLPLGSATIATPTGYQWSFVGTLGANATIDSGTVSSRIILVRFTSNAASAAGDSVRVCYTSSCGNSPNKSSKLTNTILNPPAAPASITITALAPTICGAKIYRYTAPAMVAATTTAGVATGYLWSFTGTLGANATLDSGSLTSRIIRIRFTSNAAAGVGDSVRVRYNSDCGYGLNRALKLTNIVATVPAVPTSITITAVSATTCGARVYRYTAPALPAATATASSATGYEWAFTGVLGANGVIDSGTINSQIIRIRYSSNVAAGAGDSVKLRYISSCGYSNYKASKLSNTGLTCPLNVPVAKLKEVKSDMQIEVYPNPSTNVFQVKIESNANEKINLRVVDMQGRGMKSMEGLTNKSIPIGNDLPAGNYILEARRGVEVKTMKLIKM